VDKELQMGCPFGSFFKLPGGEHGDILPGLEICFTVVLIWVV